MSTKQLGSYLLIVILLSAISSYACISHNDTTCNGEGPSCADSGQICVSYSCESGSGTCYGCMEFGATCCVGMGYKYCASGTTCCPAGCCSTIRYPPTVQYSSTTQYPRTTQYSSTTTVGYTEAAKSSDTTYIIAGAGAAGAILLTIIAYCVYKRRCRKDSEHPAESPLLFNASNIVPINDDVCADDRAGRCSPRQESEQSLLGVQASCEFEDIIIRPDGWFLRIVKRADENMPVNVVRSSFKKRINSVIISADGKFVLAVCLEESAYEIWSRTSENILTPVVLCAPLRCNAINSISFAHDATVVLWHNDGGRSFATPVPSTRLCANIVVVPARAGPCQKCTHTFETAPNEWKCTCLGNPQLFLEETTQCQRCDKVFTMTVWRKRCYGCGQCLCADCCAVNAYIWDKKTLHKVCYVCYARGKVMASGIENNTFEYKIFALAEQHDLESMSETLKDLAELQPGENLGRLLHLITPQLRSVMSKMGIDIDTACVQDAVHAAFKFLEDAFPPPFNAAFTLMHSVTKVFFRVTRNRRNCHELYLRILRIQPAIIKFYEQQKSESATNLHYKRFMEGLEETIKESLTLFEKFSIASDSSGSTFTRASNFLSMLTTSEEQFIECHQKLDRLMRDFQFLHTILSPFNIEAIISTFREEKSVLINEIHQQYTKPIESKRLKRGTVIGSGGTATVYEATLDGVDVVAKVYKAECIDEAKREYELLKRLVASQCFVNCFGILDDGLTLVLEKMGEDLERRVFQPRGRPGLSRVDKFFITYTLLKALRELHSQSPSIYHRDIKCSNILFGVNGGPTSIKLIDFGSAVSRATTWRTTVAQLRSSGGRTLPYVAPEVLDEGNDGRYDEGPVDMYALGVTLFELWTETHVYASLTTNAQLIAAKESGPPATVAIMTEQNSSRNGKQVPYIIARFIESFYATKPGERIDAHNAVRALQNLLKTSKFRYDIEALLGATEADLGGVFSISVTSPATPQRLPSASVAIPIPEWMTQLSLSDDIKQRLVANGIDEKSTLLILTETDIASLNFNLGERKKILVAIESLK